MNLLKSTFSLIIGMNIYHFAEAKTKVQTPPQVPVFERTEASCQLEIKVTLQDKTVAKIQKQVHSDLIPRPDKKSLVLIPLEGIEYQLAFNASELRDSRGIGVLELSVTYDYNPNPNNNRGGYVHSALSHFQGDDYQDRMDTELHIDTWVDDIARNRLDHFKIDCQQSYRKIQ